MKMKKVLALGLAVAMTATMFVGCGSKKDDGNTSTTNNDSNGGKQSVELKVWGPQEEQELMKQLCEKFNEQEDEFDVKFDGDFDNADARIAYQAVKNTPEFKKFRDVMVKQYTKEITSNFLNSIESIKDLIKQAGE